MEFCVVLVTVPNSELGESIAQALVQEKWAACVNRIPGLRSIYTWQGKIENESEELLIIKTRRSLVDTIIEKVCGLHTYQLPEIIALPIIQGNAAYLDWIAQETRLE